MPSFNISRFLLVFGYTFCLLSLQSQADPLAIWCPNTVNYTSNSTFAANLKTLLSSLSSNATRDDGFFNSTAGNNLPDAAYGLFLCRGDLSAVRCQDCVGTAAAEVTIRCPVGKQATIWYDECMLRYSNQYIFSILDQPVAVMLSNVQNITDPTRLNEVLGEIMGDIATRASNSGSGKKFATRETNFSALQQLYGLGQCTPDITSSECNQCLRFAISSFPACCNGKLGGRVLSPNCNVRYEMYPFYDVAATPPPLPPVLSPPLARSPGKGGVSSKLLIAIIVPVGVSVLIFILGFCCILSKKAKKEYYSIKEDTVGDEITTIQTLQYDLGTIQAATNNFSDDHKLGEGGFGCVYKGTLPNGEEIAVKRLSQNSGQGAEEFKNEVVLVAKLQHRNLARLLGFCLEGEEKILIYEFVPNKSLDYFLFDPQEQEKLDWSRRYKIIGGIARGMLYLHEDSRLRIIHRDLKASNILLDGDMGAKIADFGMARIFGVDQTQGNTGRVVGTFGYMSPEYVMHGQFSVKSDVFSFGILVLEIISGKKITNFHQSGFADDLRSYAWKLWTEERALDLMDPTLGGSYSRNEVIRCIHIALLCVQDNPDARPSMATVVLMLNSYSASLSLPQQPAFFSPSITGLSASKPDQSTSKSFPLSVNEMSISEIDPR